MTENKKNKSPRRGFLKSISGMAGLTLTGAIAGCTQSNPDSSNTSGNNKQRRLKAAFTNGGLTTTWCKMGYDAAKLWGDLLNVEVVWLDGELNPQKQREKLELHVDEDFDFCCFQALQTGALAEPVKQIAKRGIPIISMDTRLVEKDEFRATGLWTRIAADHEKLGVEATTYLFDKIGAQGEVIHIGGSSAHSGARAREKGFKKVLAKYPGIKVTGGGIRWCDWKTEKARNTFENLLQTTSKPIAGAFFHNDDMALACIPALKNTVHEGMIITSVDGQKTGLQGVRDDLLAATVINPTSMIHMLSLVVGQFIVRNNEKIEDVPREIALPGPLVSKDTNNLDAMFYMSDVTHCLI